MCPDHGVRDEALLYHHPLQQTSHVGSSRMQMPSLASYINTG